MSGHSLRIPGNFMHRIKFSLALFSIAFLAAAVCQQHPETAPKMRFSEIEGLRGPIHTQLDSSKKLNDDPRENPRIHVRSQEGWLEFAPDGTLAEHGTLDSSGRVTNRVREKRDADGNSTESIFVDTDSPKVIRQRVENDKPTDGVSETKIFTDEKLTTRIVNIYNPQTSQGESTTFDAEGNIVGHSTGHRNPDRQESEVYGPGGRFIVHSLRRFNSHNELTETLRYDAEGKVISDLSFKDGVLTSWWQDPKCECTNGAGFHQPDGTTVSYNTTKEGRLLKNIQHHVGRPTNHEIDDEELYDESGQLLERIAYTYERDAHGNWTQRIASILDHKTNTMVPVREDTRILTYY